MLLRYLLPALWSIGCASSAIDKGVCTDEDRDIGQICIENGCSYSLGQSADGLDDCEAEGSALWQSGSGSCTFEGTGECVIVCDCSTLATGADSGFDTESGQSGEATYDAVGDLQYFTVPEGVETLEVYLWGAGGGGGGASKATAPGGGGGFVTGHLAVVPGETLAVSVGEGGSAGVDSAVIHLAFGGGGASGAAQTGWTGEDWSTNERAGGGGGYSAVLRSGAVVALAGGGGGGGNGSTTGGTGGAGGAGGGSVGGTGASGAANAVGTGGLGGEPSTGGAPGTSAGTTTSDAEAGGALAGGQGASLASASCRGAGGGGGGGWYGGGGGGAADEVETCAGGGGGGGSSLVTGLSSPSTEAGNGRQPGGYAEAVRAGAGLGGDVDADGEGGRVVLRW